LPTTAGYSERAALAQPTLPRALLVAGPSAAGKSTFISQLKAGQIGAEIAARMPGDAAEWPLVNGNDVLKLGLPMLAEQGRTRGLIIHYDITHIPRFLVRGGYAADPLFQFLQQVETLTIVDIRVPAERLLEHLKARRGKIREKKSIAQRLSSAFIRAPTQWLKRRLPGKRRILKTDAFMSEEWLEECYRAWDLFIAGTTSKRSVARVTVEPWPGHGDGASFRLARDSDA
jgi:hypothetical protein